MRAFEQRKKNNSSSSNFFSPKIQPKLKTGTVGDKYEVEADKVADKVVNKSSSKGLLQSKAEEEVQQKPLSETISTVQKQEMKEEKDPVQKKEEEDKSVQKKEEEKEPVQKKEEEDKSVQKKEEEKEPVQKKEEEDKSVQKKEEEKEPVQKKDDKEEPVQKKEEEEMPVQKKEEKEEKVQAKCDTCGEEEKVQKKSNDSSQTEIEDNGIETKLNNSKGGGNKMDKNTQQEMESGFGTNFSNVKIHTDSNAVQMNQEIGAQAFTNGSDVYFNKGKYNPDSKEGKHLLAHELTHTVQQTGKTQNTIQKQKAKKKPVEVDCCNDDGITVLPFNDIEFNINDEVSSAATFCSKGSFKITSEAKWETKHKAKKYEIRVESSDSTSEILKPNRSFDIGKKETQTFKLSKTDEWGCANFRVIVKIISPKYSPMLKGKFSVLKMK